MLKLSEEILRKQKIVYLLKGCSQLTEIKALRKSWVENHMKKGRDEINLLKMENDS